MFSEFLFRKSPKDLRNPDKNNGHVISLVPISLTLHGGSVNQYEIINWKFKETANNKITVEIEFKRQRMYYILNVILPIILINVVGFKDKVR